MEEHTVPVSHLVLPVLLPFAQRGFLQQTVGLDDQLRSSGLKTYTTLDTDDGVTHIGITTDGIRGTDLLDLLDSLHLVIEMLSIHGHDLSLLKLDLQQRLLLRIGDMLQISLLGQTLGRIKQLTTADAGTPDADVV